MSIDLAVVFCNTFAKYFINSINDLHTNQAGTNIAMQPQDNGYECKTSFIRDTVTVIGARNAIKFLQVDAVSKALA